MCLHSHRLFNAGSPPAVQMTSKEIGIGEASKSAMLIGIGGYRKSACHDPANWTALDTAVQSKGTYRRRLQGQSIRADDTVPITLASYSTLELASPWTLAFHLAPRKKRIVSGSQTNKIRSIEFLVSYYNMYVHGYNESFRACIFAFNELWSSWLFHAQAPVTIALESVQPVSEVIWRLNPASSGTNHVGYSILTPQSSS